MSQLLSLELNDDLYLALSEQANLTGLPVSEWIVSALNQAYVKPLRASAPATFLQTAQSLSIEGPIHWSTQPDLLYPESSDHV